MAPETLAEAERLILAARDLDAVCEALGCTRRTLERAFVAAHGTTPARWRRAQRPIEPIPPVSFRLPADLWADLRAAAEAEGVEPNAWAKAAVLRALALLRENDGPVAFLVDSESAPDVIGDLELLADDAIGRRTLPACPSTSNR